MTASYSRLINFSYGVLLAALLHPNTAAAADIDLTQPLRKVETKVPARFGDGTTSRVVELTTWQNDLLVGDVIGKTDRGLFCAEGDVIRNSKFLDSWLLTQLTKVFKERAIDLGLTSTAAAKSVFDDNKSSAADFKVGATLLNMDYRVCRDSYDKVKGDAYAKMRWEVFAARRQKVVYTSVVEASYSSSERVVELDFSKAFLRSMVNNLLADPRFVEMIRSGGATDDAKTFAPLQIKQGQVVAGDVSKMATELRTAVVTVESGISTGTAFYISQEGYLLTNSHVVGDAKFVRVRLANGRNVIGEVVRLDKPRDVALVQTDPVSAGVLAQRREAANAGEEVYAMGSPFGEVLSGTLTRGVLSASRVLEGMAYLQSDVAINPGNSGGPLLDARGQVIGIAQIGTDAKGISLFIPIGEALSTLSLTLGDRGTAGQAQPQAADAKKPDGRTSPN